MPAKFWGNTKTATGEPGMSGRATLKWSVPLSTYLWTLLRALFQGGVRVWIGWSRWACVRTSCSSICMPKWEESRLWGRLVPMGWESPPAATSCWSNPAFPLQKLLHIKLQLINLQIVDGRKDIKLEFRIYIRSLPKNFAIHTANGWTGKKTLLKTKLAYKWVCCALSNQVCSRILNRDLKPTCLSSCKLRWWPDVSWPEHSFSYALHRDSSGPVTSTWDIPERSQRHWNWSSVDSCPTFQT